MQGKISIEQRLFRLVLWTGLVCFLAFAVVSFYGLYAVRGYTLTSGQEMGSEAAAFAEQVTDEQAKQRFALLAREKAHRIDSEMSRIKEDTELLARTMTQILTHREMYLPRRLPVGGESPIASGQPYLFFTPALRASGHISDVLPDADIAANAADNMALWADTYDPGHELTYFYAAELGYIISVDIMADRNENVNFYDEWYDSSFEPRNRPWYKEVKATGKTVFTNVYVGIEGYPTIACMAPYYDEQGFAGGAGIAHNIDSLYRQLATWELEGTNVNFILNAQGQVLLSSEKEGPLSVSDTGLDLRCGTEQDLALKAVSMVGGKTDVTTVMLAGKEYYLAYAPIPSMGWSYGTVIEKAVILQPSQDAKAHLLEQAAKFSSALSGIFWDNLWRMAVLLLSLLVMLYFFSRKAADRFVQPLLTLTAGVREIAAGNLGRKLFIDTGDEIQQLADGFNHMTDELKIYIKNLEKTTAENERIETELNIAARIQLGILPKDFSLHKGLDIFATMIPAREVGGDFYDFRFLDDHRLLITIADVSDKGVPAALFMVRAKTVLGSSILMAKNEGGSLADAIAIANDELCQNNEEDLFVTVFTAIIDIITGKMTYVNAGHSQPVLIPQQAGQADARTACCLPKGKNPMLAVMEDLLFEEETIQLSRQDTLFLYTDGVTEAMNRNKEMFTKETLLQTLNFWQKGTAEEIVSGCLQAVEKHASGAAASDDITMLCIRWLGV